MEGVLTAGMATFIPVLAMGGLGHAKDRIESDLSSLSFVSMTITCFCTNLRLAIEVHSWSVLEHAALWLTLIVFEALCLAMAYYHPTGLLEAFPYTSWGRFNDTLPKLYSQRLFWLVMLLSVAVALLIPRVHVMGRMTSKKKSRVLPKVEEVDLEIKR